MKTGINFPSFDSPFLEEVALSLRKRSKAIKNRAVRFTCERVRELRDSGDYELMEMQIELHRTPRIQFSFKLWSDRWLWIDIRQPSKRGWLFDWQHDGRVGDTEPSGIVESIITTLKIPYSDDVLVVRSKLDNLWAKVALGGPRTAQTLP